MAIKLENRFSVLKEDFKKDTGYEFSKENMELYIQYVNFRANQNTAQLLNGLVHELLNKIDFLPGIVSLRMGEMLREHHTIKEIIQALKSKP